METKRTSVVEREIMVLPFNGNRADAVRVFSLENEHGLPEYGYKAVRDGTEWTFTDELSAFTKAFELAAWNVVCLPRYWGDHEAYVNG